ncbi:ROK family protein [Vibrio rumoiensis]|uniref:Transcriptional regulator n=1 Tax=Vibrio rumoiensis 1S-45 TaxID=1188252 RepID=A0A1E5DZH1_9VIBR|nr:ROK family protein [Vibrio rumoiensis]OEF23275.1 transcriptional regulator [Vibrio rumoiensis 1S-45]
MYRLGLDVGGTKIEAVVIDKNNHVIFQKRISTPTDAYSSFLSSLISFISQIQMELSEPFTIGIGLPGAISPDTGKIKNCNCLILNGEDLKSDLSLAFDQPIYIANDADCFTLSEAMDGAGSNHTTVFGVIIGTGCGGGITMNRQLLSGPNAIAGEWGHNILPQYSESKDGTEQLCYCGRENCIERYISGTGFAVRYNQKYSSDLKAIDIIEKMRSGDKSAVEHYELLVDMCARSLASVINILDPHVIVLGGGLSNVDELYEDIPKVIGQYVFSDVCNTQIVKAKFGDSSGVRGACWLPEMHQAKH